jgi:hypothetical protein
MPKRIYGKTVRELFNDLLADIKLKPGENISRSQIGDWFKKKYPKIKPATVYCHCIRLSTNVPDRVHYKADQSDDVFFRVERGLFRLYEPKTDPPPIYVKGEVPAPQPQPRTPDPEEREQEFAYEKDLQQFLAKNLGLIEPGLQLYEDEEDPNITGLEFPVEDRRIDILATDKSGDYVVVELKVSKGHERVVGQLLRYMGWIKQNLANTNQKVRGVIIAREISEDLKLATSVVHDVRLLEYELRVTLHEVANGSK